VVQAPYRPGYRRKSFSGFRAQGLLFWGFFYAILNLDPKPKSCREEKKKRFGDPYKMGTYRGEIDGDDDEKKKDEDDKGEMLSVSMDELPELVKDEEIRCAFTVHILNQATACIMFTECQTPFSIFTFYFFGAGGTTVPRET
jgi:hypothetical protein